VKRAAAHVMTVTASALAVSCTSPVVDLWLAKEPHPSDQELALRADGTGDWKLDTVDWVVDGTSSSSSGPPQIRGTGDVYWTESDHFGVALDIRCPSGMCEASAMTAACELDDRWGEHLHCRFGNFFISFRRE
jgi:hypothetical protein